MKLYGDNGLEELFRKCDIPDGVIKKLKMGKDCWKDQDKICLQTMLGFWLVYISEFSDSSFSPRKKKIYMSGPDFSKKEI